MASRTRRTRVVLAVVALAVIGLGVWRGEAVYWLVTTRTVVTWYSPSVDIRTPEGVIQTREKHAARGIDRYSRWTGKAHGWSRNWYTETGKLRCETKLHDGGLVRLTAWRFDGSVDKQIRSTGPSNSNGSTPVEEKTKAPWWWGVTAQTEPTMPAWMKDDAKWAKALEEAR